MLFEFAALCEELLHSRLGGALCATSIWWCGCRHSTWCDKEGGSWRINWEIPERDLKCVYLVCWKSSWARTRFLVESFVQIQLREKILISARTYSLHWCDCWLQWLVLGSAETTPTVSFSKLCTSLVLSLLMTLQLFLLIIFFSQVVMHVPLCALNVSLLQEKHLC